MQRTGDPARGRFGLAGIPINREPLRIGWAQLDANH
jgi:hypothetical protein